MANWDTISGNGDVEDRRGTTPAIAFAGGGGLVVLLLTLGLNFLGLNIPQSTVEDVLSGVQALGTTQATPQEQATEFRGVDSYELFTKKVLGSTNTLWDGVFAQNNLSYIHPKLVLFRQATQSGCGVATTQVGPHFCPNDSTIYLDETFFDELHTRFGADTGEVAQAYVIAHEVGHNVQNQLGAFDNRVAQTQQGSVAIELQADCYAGVWAYSIAKQGVFQGNEIEQALGAAAAVGDDHIQQVETGYTNPETWTHGSSAERVAAFTKGYTTGKPSTCQGF
ncbi:neutral zinc metallopeptidase [Candidatus Saccharibacteria bacterium]|nr:MAG: neutral zinc metallopeptidase [Candidatus Saccharibacteria bacterium]